MKFILKKTQQVKVNYHCGTWGHDNACDEKSR